MTGLSNNRVGIAIAVITLVNIILLGAFYYTRYPTTNQHDLPKNFFHHFDDLRVPVEEYYNSDIKRDRTIAYRGYGGLYHAGNIRELYGNYTLFHQETMERELRAYNQLNRRFLLWKPTSKNFGVQMDNLITMFLFALISERALIIVRDDFDTESVMVSNDYIQWNYNKLRDEFNMHKHEIVRKDYKTIFNSEVDFNIQPPAHDMETRILKHSDIDYLYKEFLTQDLKTWIISPIVYIESEVSLVSAIERNPHYAKHFSRLFGSHAELYWSAYRYLFTPSQSLENYMSKLVPKDQKFNNLVGFYIRSSVLNKGELDEFIGCAKESAKDPKTAIFLTYDNETVLNRLKEAIPDQLILAKQVHSVVYATNANEIVSWWILGECDALVVTQGSTFGITAALQTHSPVYGLPYNHRGFAPPQWCVPWYQKEPYSLIVFFMILELVLGCLLFGTLFAFGAMFRMFINKS